MLAACSPSASETEVGELYPVYLSDSRQDKRNVKNQFVIHMQTKRLRLQIRIREGDSTNGGNKPMVELKCHERLRKVPEIELEKASHCVRVHLLR